MEKFKTVSEHETFQVAKVIMVSTPRAAISGKKSYSVKSSKKVVKPFIEEFESEMVTINPWDDDRNIIRLVRATRHGLNFRSFKYVLENLPLSLNEWSEILHSTLRTIQRIQTEKRDLNSTQSEKLIEVSLLFEQGINVFGSKEKFINWLSRKNIALGGTSPRSLLDTYSGIKMIKDELVRIEHGIFS